MVALTLILYSSKCVHLQHKRNHIIKITSTIPYMYMCRRLRHRFYYSCGARTPHQIGCRRHHALTAAVINLNNTLVYYVGSRDTSRTESRALVTRVCVCVPTAPAHIRFMEERQPYRVRAAKAADKLSCFVYQARWVFSSTMRCGNNMRCVLYSY